MYFINYMDKDTKAAADVVKKYFIYENDQNVTMLSTVLTEKYKLEDKKDPNFKSIKLLRIKVADNTYKESYKDKENTKIFLVKFDIQFKDDTKAVTDNGSYWWTFTVVRKNVNSPWLISGFGVC